MIWFEMIPEKCLYNFPIFLITKFIFIIVKDKYLYQDNYYQNLDLEKFYAFVRKRLPVFPGPESYARLESLPV